MLLLELPPKQREEIKAFFETRGQRAMFIEEGDIHGLIIQDEFVEPILKFLGMQEAGRSQHAKYAGFTIVHTQFPPRNLSENVICQDWDVEFSSGLIDLLNIFAMSLQDLGRGRLVVRTKPNSGNLDSDPTDFRLNLFQSPKEDSSALRDHASFSGLYLPNKLLPYSNLGIPIYDDNFVVGAELYGQNDLYILFNIGPRPSLPEIKALFRCLHQTLELLPLSEAEKNLRKQEYLNHQMQEIEKTIDRQISALVIQAQELIEEKRSEIEESQSELAQMYRELANLEETESQARRQAQQMKQRLREEYLLIRGLPKVIKIFWENGVFVVLTEELIGFDSRTNKYHAFGEFRIELNPLADGDNAPLKLINLTRRRLSIGERDMAAPHVRSSGHACLGDFYGSLPRAIREFRLFDAVSLAIDLVQNVNVQDAWGSDIHFWPEVLVTVKDSVVRRAQPE
jgi:hypothetical protein